MLFIINGTFGIKGKSLKILTVFLLIYNINYAQSELGFQVIKDIHSNEHIEVSEFKIDNQGNKIYAGSYFGNLVFDGQNYNEEGLMAYIFKEDPDGNAQWFGNFDSNFGIFDISFDVDPMGNIYMAGTYNGDSLIYNNVVYQAANEDRGIGVFIFKLSPEGDVLWNRLIETGFRYGHVNLTGSLRWTPNGIILGIFHGSQVILNLNGATYNQSENNLQIKLIKLSETGNITNISGNFKAIGVIHNMKITKSGNVIISGFLYGYHDPPQYFGNQLIDLQDAYMHNLHPFIATYNAAFEPQWIWYGINFGEKEWELASSLYDFDIAQNGEIYAIANFTTKTDLRNGTIIQKEVPIKDYWEYFDNYILRFSPTGLLLQYQAVNAPPSSFGYGLVIKNNEIIVADAGRENNTFHTYDMDLNLLNETKITGVFIPTELTLQADNNIYCAGTYHNYFQGGNQIRANTSAGYVAKFIACENVPFDFDELYGPKSFCVENGDPLLYTSKSYPDNNYLYVWEIPELFNENGTIVTNTNYINLTPNTDGNYQIKVKLKTECDTESNTLIMDLKAQSSIPSLIIEPSICQNIINSLYQDSVYIFHNGIEKGIYLSNEFQVVEKGTYKVKVSNTCGTFESNEIYLNPLVKENVFLPNVITPNNDGLNDVFDLSNIYKVNSIEIYNRWGGKVYEGVDYQNNWEGENVASGNYYYYLNSECMPNPLKGLIQIIK